MQLSPRQNKLPIPSETDMELSTISSRVLASHLDSDNATQVLTINSQTENSESVVIPTRAYQLLIEILAQMSQGNGVALIPIQRELTTQQAANILNVSRPYLIKLLDSGAIPYRKVGKHRRILTTDLYQYKAIDDEKRNQSLDQLTALSQELDLYDE